MMCSILSRFASAGFGATATNDAAAFAASIALGAPPAGFLVFLDDAAAVFLVDLVFFKRSMLAYNRLLLKR